MKMWLISLLCCVVLIETSPIADDSESDCYEPEVLRSQIGRPYHLSMDYSRNTVYFSFSPTENEDDESSRSAFINLHTKEFGTIDDVSNGFAQTVDRDTNEIFIGGDKGIYRFNPGTNTSLLVGAETVSIWMLFSRHVLYYSDFPSQFLYTIAKAGDEEPNRFNGLRDTKVDHFVIDGEGDIIYSNDTGLFYIERTTMDIVLVAKSIAIRGLALDITGKPYTALNDGIYYIDKETYDLIKLIDVSDGFGLAFDAENNYIYSDCSKIYRLRAGKPKCEK